MQIIIEDSHLEYVRPIIRRIAAKYRERMIHKAVISGKFHETRVMVSPSCTGETAGFHILGRNPDGLVSYVQLYIAPEQSDAYIAFIIAHEFAHVLFAETLDATCERPMGSLLEESMADNVALFILSHCRFSDEEGTLSTHLLTDPWRRTLAQRLAEGFGDALEAGCFLDDFLEGTVRIGSDDPLYPHLQKQLNIAAPEEELTIKVSTIHNRFWYCAALNRFHRIVESFDETMGAGAFEALKEELDTLFEAPEPDAAIRSRVDAVLDAFLDLRRKEKARLRTTEEERLHRKLIARYLEEAGL